MSRSTDCNGYLRRHHDPIREEDARVGPQTAEKPPRFLLLFSGCEAPQNLRFMSLTPWRGKKKPPSVNGGRLLFSAPSLGGLITLLLRLAVPIAPNGGHLLVLRFVSMWG